MTITKQIAKTLVITLFSLLATAQAQTARLSTVNITSDGERVHIAAQGDVSELRADVTDEAGDVVFQSGAISGNALDWKMTDSQGERVAPGTYLVTVTFRTPAGKLRKRVEQVTVDEAENSSTPTPTAPSATPTPLPVKTTGTVTAGRIPKFFSIGTSAAAITNSVMTESGGRIGIGTTSPSQLLHIKSVSGNAAALVETPAGRFAQYQLKGGATAPWIIGTQDNFAANALLFRNGSSDLMVIAPSGNVGVGTNNPQSRLNVNAQGYGVTHSYGAVTVGTYVDATGGWLGTKSGHPLYFSPTTVRRG
jgi:hypothetical protein